MPLAVHMLRIDQDLLAEVKEMAINAGLPLAAYLRLVVKQHVRTPLRIELERPRRERKSA